jgi:anti-sigma regulatory factor (Ser/Thr protein kinase)
VTSELVTNAVVHAGGATQVLLHLCRDRLTIAVRDGTDAPPRLRAGQHLGENGRGLYLVEALTCADGTYGLP